MERKVLICGAGLGGLCAAWWLQRHGVDTVLVEKSDVIRADGYMVGVAGLGRQVLEQMGLLSRLREMAIPFQRSLYLDGAGKTIMNLEYGHLLRQMDHFTVLRADMVALLHQALDGAGELRLGCTVSTLRQDDDGVDVIFSDGRQERYAHVLGADGFRSATRRMAFGPDASYTHDLGLQAAAYWLDGAYAMEEDQLSIAETRCLSMYYRIPGTHDGVTASRVAALHIWRGGRVDGAPEQRQAQLAEQFAGSHARVLDGIAAMAPQQLYLDSLMQVDVPVWHAGRVALLGDAAHCLSLANGQGASMALAGAACLGQELGLDNSPAAFRRYQQRMQGGITALQRRGRRVARMYVPDTAWSCWLRNSLMRILPPSLLVKSVASSAKAELKLTRGIAVESVTQA